MIWGKIALGLVALCLFLAVSTMDYEDELAERELSCDMVKEGKWPDYKGIAERECEAKG